MVQESVIPFILRRNLGLTQEKFGLLFGVHAMTVSKWERGVLSPNYYQMALMQAFKRISEEKDVRKTVNRILIGEGVIATIYFLLKYGRF